MTSFYECVSQYINRMPEHMREDAIDFLDQHHAKRPQKVLDYLEQKQNGILDEEGVCVPQPAELIHYRNPNQGSQDTVTQVITSMGLTPGGGIGSDPNHPEQHRLMETNITRLQSEVASKCDGGVCDNHEGRLIILEAGGGNGGSGDTQCCNETRTDIDTLRGDVTGIQTNVTLVNATAVGAQECCDGNTAALTDKCDKSVCEDNAAAAAAAQTAAETAQTTADGKCDQGDCDTNAAAAAAAQTAADNAQTAADTAQSEVDALETVVEGKCDQGDCTANAGRITDLEGKIDSLNLTHVDHGSESGQAFEELSERIANNTQIAIEIAEGKCDQGTCDDHGSAIGGLEEDVVKAQECCEDARTNATALQTTVSVLPGMQANITANQECCKDAQSNTTALETRLEGVDTTIGEIQGDVTELGTVVEGKCDKTTCDTHNTTLGQHATTLGTHTTTLASHGADITTLGGTGGVVAKCDQQTCIDYNDRINGIDKDIEEVKDSIIPGIQDDLLIINSTFTAEIDKKCDEATCTDHWTQIDVNAGNIAALNVTVVNYDNRVTQLETSYNALSQQYNVLVTRINECCKTEVPPVGGDTPEPVQITSEPIQRTPTSLGPTQDTSRSTEEIFCSGIRELVYYMGTTAGMDNSYCDSVCPETSPGFYSEGEVYTSMSLNSSFTGEDVLFELSCKCHCSETSHYQYHKVSNQTWTLGEQCCVYKAINEIKTQFSDTICQSQGCQDHLSDHLEIQFSIASDNPLKINIFPSCMCNSIHSGCLQPERLHNFEMQCDVNDLTTDPVYVCPSCEEIGGICQQESSCDVSRQIPSHEDCGGEASLCQSPEVCCSPTPTAPYGTPTAPVVTPTAPVVTPTGIPGVEQAVCTPEEVRDYIVEANGFYQGDGQYCFLHGCTQYSYTEPYVYGNLTLASPPSFSGGIGFIQSCCCSCSEYGCHHGIISSKSCAFAEDLCLYKAMREIQENVLTCDHDYCDAGQSNRWIQLRLSFVGDEIKINPSCACMYNSECIYGFDSALYGLSCNMADPNGDPVYFS